MTNHPSLSYLCVMGSQVSEWQCLLRVQWASSQKVLMFKGFHWFFAATNKLPGSKRVCLGSLLLPIVCLGSKEHARMPLKMSLSCRLPQRIVVQPLLRPVLASPFMFYSVHVLMLPVTTSMR